MEKYFIASNSSNGFCSYYDKAFDIRKFYKIYAIKGGSGTGKAFFMREVAKRAEEKGFSVRYIYCSSDSSSLDAIIVNELKLAVLDGTAPHVYEPRMIGALDEIVDLGAFLNGELLSKSRRLISDMCEKKQMGFERVYRYLDAYRALSENIESLVTPCLKREKIDRYVQRFAENIAEENGIEENLLVRSIGMRGLSSFDTYYERAKIYYEINDYFETAHIMMKEIYSLMKKKNTDLYVSNNPIISSRIDALSCERTGLTFEIGNRMSSSSRAINMKRFVDNSAIAEIRQDYRALARTRDYVLELALLEFEKIRKYHFVLEDIYGSAMDFVAKEQFTKEFCNKIFENN